MDNEEKLTPELQEKLEQIKLDEEKKVNKKDKKIGPLIAAVVVLLAISAVAIIFTVMKKNNPPKTAETSETKEETKESELTSLEKTELYKKVALLSTTDYDSAENSDYLKDGNLYTRSFMLTKIPDFYENEGLSKKDKLYSLLYILRHDEKRFEAVSRDTFPEASARKYVKSNTLVASLDEFYDNIKILPESYVANRYEELYGEKLENSDSNDICGGFNYDEENKVYLSGLNDACGGIDRRNALIRIYDIKKDDTGFKVYANGVTIYAGDDIETNKPVCKVYKEIFDLDIREDNEKKFYKDCEMNDQLETNFKLTDEDKDSVQKYLFTFDSDYHFKSIKKL